MNLFKKLFGKWRKKQEEIDFEEDWEESKEEERVDFTNKEEIGRASCRERVY